MMNYRNFNLLDKKSADTLDSIKKILNKYKDKIDDSNVLTVMKGATTLLDVCEKNQCIITIKIEIEDILKIVNSNKPQDELFEIFLKDDNKYLMEVVNHSKQHPLLKDKLCNYEDAFTAYNNKTYYSSCVALFSIVDYLLSTITNKTDTNLIKKTRTLSKHLKSKEYFGLFVCSAFLSLNSFFKSSNFSKKSKEPKNLNRHWILHGRSTRNISQYDCIKLFCLIDALLKAGMLYIYSNSDTNTIPES